MPGTASHSLVAAASPDRTVISIATRMGNAYCPLLVDTAITLSRRARSIPNARAHPAENAGSLSIRHVVCTANVQQTRTVLRAHAALARRNMCKVIAFLLIARRTVTAARDESVVLSWGASRCGRLPLLHCVGRMCQQPRLCGNNAVRVQRNHLAMQNESMSEYLIRDPRSDPSIGARRFKAPRIAQSQQVAINNRPRPA